VLKAKPNAIHKIATLAFLYLRHYPFAKCNTLDLNLGLQNSKNSKKQIYQHEFAASYKIYFILL